MAYNKRVQEIIDVGVEDWLKQSGLTDDFGNMVASLTTTITDTTTFKDPTGLPVTIDFVMLEVAVVKNDSYNFIIQNTTESEIYGVSLRIGSLSSINDKPIIEEIELLNDDAANRVYRLMAAEGHIVRELRY